VEWERDLVRRVEAAKRAGTVLRRYCGEAGAGWHVSKRGLNLSS
jgi:hypothetical protein